ncbi:extracellular solute-binding protein [Thalassotalea sp. G2M2-11]|uniref:sugar ABC transporter substrate-binding protein n=1 Tax=Thalassotalea sp. G2M2-11 TaxID=2787627 RepID=UPI0019D140C9|nr:extracellular solute-binding protein [Thalassotalea sp. G2M2-11]
MIRWLLLLAFSSFTTFATPSIKFVFTYEGQHFEKIIEIFSQHEGIVVERLWASQSDLKAQLLEYIEKDNAPDVVLIPADHIGLHQLMRYSEIPEELQSAQTIPSLWQSVLSDNKTFGIPVVQGNQLMLYYNKRFIDKPATSWQKVYQQQQTFLEQNPKTKFIAWNYQEMYWFSPFFNAFGGNAITNGKISLNTQAMANALTTYKQLADNQLIQKDCDYDCASSSFVNHQLAYIINGDWSFKEYYEKLGDDLGIAPLPAIDQQTPLVSYFSTHVLAFPNNSLTGPKKEALYKLINFMQQQVAQEQIWLTMKTLPVHQKVFERITQSQSALVQQLIFSLEHSKLMPSDSAMSFAWSAMRKGFLRYQAGILNAEQSAELMQKIATTKRP